MNKLNAILSHVDERHIAQRFGIPYDEARSRFSPARNTVSTFEEFDQTNTRFVQDCFATCVAPGATLPAPEASARAKEHIEREYRRHNGNIVSAYNDAHDGTNGGMRHILDIIADGLKFEATERYIRHVFDTQVSPVDWEAKVELIRELIARLDPALRSRIDADHPERYAQDHTELVRAYVDAANRMASMYRRM